MLVAGPYHGVMIITAYVGVDQWLLMVTFLISSQTDDWVLLEHKDSMQNTGQDKASFQAGAITSPWRKHQSSQFSSPAISSSRGTIESQSLSKFSGQKINVFPITPGPGWLAWLALFCLNNNSRKYQGLPSLLSLQ